MVSMTFALECTVHFLSEKRTELYMRYCSGVSQLKNAASTKSTLQSRALPSLERCSA
jgi:hypothetical protein